MFLLRSHWLATQSVLNRQELYFIVLRHVTNHYDRENIQNKSETIQSFILLLVVRGWSHIFLFFRSYNIKVIGSNLVVTWINKADNLPNPAQFDSNKNLTLQILTSINSIKKVWRDLVAYTRCLVHRMWQVFGASLAKWCIGGNLLSVQTQTWPHGIFYTKFFVF